MATGIRIRRSGPLVARARGERQGDVRQPERCPLFQAGQGYANSPCGTNALLRITRSRLPRARGPASSRRRRGRAVDPARARDIRARAGPGRGARPAARGRARHERFGLQPRGSARTQRRGHAPQHGEAHQAAMAARERPREPRDARRARLTPSDRAESASVP